MPDDVMELSLANVPLRVRPHECERQAAQARYLPFRSPVGSEAVEVRTSFDSRLKLPAIDTPWPGAVCERKGDSLVFTRRDDQLLWDVPARRARFIMAKAVSSQPLPDTLPPFVETALRMVLATELICAGGLLMHACGWADAERSVLFAGFSGGGKTTTARKLPDNEVLSDDQVAVRNGRAWSLPFVGQWDKRTKPRNAPLKAMALLGKSTSPGLRRLPPARALARILGCVVSFDPAQTSETFQIAARLVDAVPVYELELDLDTPVAPWIERMCRG